MFIVIAGGGSKCGQCVGWGGVAVTVWDGGIDGPPHLGSQEKLQGGEVTPTEMRSDI